MNAPHLLLRRLDDIGISLSKRGDALALIGLGSVGTELHRLDAFSDLDFFVIVKAGSKARYIEELDWLTAVSPTAYYFPNTKDGYKLLYEDGIFCEFAVFEQSELATIPFAQGRIVWKADGVNDAIATPTYASNQHDEQHSIEWHIGEALTNLYIGLLRDHRGEKLSAMRFIQHYAVNRVLDLAKQIEKPTAVSKDSFSIERRYEMRFPNMAPLLPTFMQGYERNRESASAILAFLDDYFEINEGMKTAVYKLC